MHITAFDSPWYASRIQQTMQEIEGLKGTSPDALAIARSILEGFAYLSQSIDHLGDASNSDSAVSAVALELRDLAASVSEIADKMSDGGAGE